MPYSVPIVLLLGQSNMRNEELPIAAAENVAAKGGIVIHHAISGTPLSMDLDFGNGDWSAADDPDAGEHLDAALAKLDALLTPGTPTYIPGAYLAGVIWVQGEADTAFDSTSSAYHDNLVELHDLLVEDYGEHEWAVAALSGDVWEFRTAGVNRMPYWEAVRDGQLALADLDGYHVVDTEALGDELGLGVEDRFRDDFIHYEPEFATILGDRLADTLEFEGDANLQVGTKGNDVFQLDGSDVQQVFGSGGSDLVDFSGQQAGISLTVYADDSAAVSGRGDIRLEGNLVEVERVIGTDFNDVMRLGKFLRDVRTGDGDDKVHGGSHSDVIRLGEGNDVGLGRFGDDVILGDAGNDVVAGHGGNDRLYGGADDDRLMGGRGDDLLVGGRGDDLFRPQKGFDTLGYETGDNGHDVVYGFSRKEDVISFEGLGVTRDDIFLSVEESNLRIQVEMDNVSADITLINRAGMMPDDDDDPDWLSF